MTFISIPSDTAKGASNSQLARWALKKTTGWGLSMRSRRPARSTNSTRPRSMIWWRCGYSPNTAKVFPHASDDLLPSRCPEVRHRPTQVLVRALASPQLGPDSPAHKTAECRRGIDCQHPYHGGKHPKQRALERMRDVVAPKSEASILEVVGRYVFYSLSLLKGSLLLHSTTACQIMNLSPTAHATAESAALPKFRR